MSFWRRLAEIFVPRETVTERTAREMTASELEAFDRAFASMDTAFYEMDKAFKILGKGTEE